MKKEQGTKKEKIQSVIIAILSLIIILGGAYFASEIKYCETPEEVVLLQDIGMTEFTTLLHNNEPSIIYIARPGCGYCQQQKPIVESIVSEYGVVVHYLNTDNLTEDEMYSLFAVDTKLFGEDGKEFGTPTTLVVKSGKIVDSVVGLTDEDSLIDFFSKNELI